MKAPTVSIIIPTYNRATLLPRAIRSVVEQTVANWELIIVDDGGTDPTRSVVESITAAGEPRVRYVRQDHAGSSAARNRGIDEARGEFIAFLDSDDEFRPRRLARQLELFARCPDVGLVYGDYAYVDTERRYHDSVFRTLSPRALRVQRRAVGVGLYKCGPGFLDELLEEYFIATITGMVRRRILDETVRFPEGLSYAEEWLFFLRIAQRTRVGFVHEPLCLHHWTDGSLSRTSVDHNLRGMVRLLDRLPGHLEPLTRRQRRAVRRNLARAMLQLGYAAHRADRFGEAARWFLRSARQRAQRPALTGAVTSLVRALTAREASHT